MNPLSSNQNVTANHKKEPLLPVDKAAERPLWIVLVIMAFLAALALMSARMGERNYNTLNTDLAGAATVQLTDITALNRLDIAQQAMTLITQTVPNLTAVRVNDADALSLIKPWLGEDLAHGLPEGIALPVLITLDGSTLAQRSTLSAALERAGITAVIDDHSEWTDGLTRASRAFSVGSWLILLLTFFAGTAASAFATQSSMLAQSKTVSVFAQIGAPDKFIARLFIMRTIKVGAISAIIGALAALIFLGVFRILRGPSEAGLLPNLTPSLSDFVMLIALCIVFTIICAVAAGVSAKQILHRTRLYT